MPQYSNVKNRPPLFRIQTIHNLICLGRLPNCTTLAKRLECTTRTIRRDIGFMRDFLCLPIEFDTGAQGYHYTTEVSALPTANFNVNEAATLERIILDFVNEPNTASTLHCILEKLITIGGLNYTSTRPELRHDSRCPSVGATFTADIQTSRNCSSIRSSGRSDQTAPTRL